MPDIKVRDAVKGTIKAIDKSAVASERMKNAYVRTKEKRSAASMQPRAAPKNTRRIVYRAALKPPHTARCMKRTGQVEKPSVM